MDVFSVYHVSQNMFPNKEKARWLMEKEQLERAISKEIIGAVVPRAIMAALQGIV